MPGRQSLRKINKCMHHIPGLSTIINSAKENFSMIAGTKSMRIRFYCSTAFVANYCKVLLTHLEHSRREMETGVELHWLISWLLQSAKRGCFGQLFKCLKDFYNIACSSLLLLPMSAVIAEKQKFHYCGLSQFHTKCNLAPILLYGEAWGLKKKNRLI